MLFINVSRRFETVASAFGNLMNKFWIFGKLQNYTALPGFSPGIYITRW
jgi:hypothetical protein